MSPITYFDQSLLSTDYDFRQRIAACVAKEDFARPGEHPTVTADRIQWDVSAEPGLAESYSYALASGVPDPGKDPSVITDEVLLAAVTAVAGGEAGVA